MKKVNLDCGTCPFKSLCPIPNDNISSFPTLQARKRLFCPKVREARRISCVTCCFRCMTTFERRNDTSVCNVKGAAIGKTLDLSFHTRPPKWCPILEAKRKGL